jgi:5-methylcytosine-specific restriction endonuclease McrA
LDSNVLVLNQNYEPLNVCNTRRAIVLIARGKAEVLEHLPRLVRSPSFELWQPSVIRLVYLVRRPRPTVKLTRREVFIRDNYTCQYCGAKTRELTIDHVLPRHYGGRHVWENVVSACKECNHRKGGKTLEEARMRLLRPPYRPRTSSYYVVVPYLGSYTEWQKFIPEWELAEQQLA